LPLASIAASTDRIAAALIETALGATFRLRFAEEDGSIWQRLAPPARLAVSRFGESSPQAAEERVREVLAADRALRFDWRNPHAPLFRASLVEAAGAPYALVTSNFHAIQDGWGNAEFLRQLLARLDPAEPVRAPDPGFGGGDLETYARQEAAIAANEQ